MAKKILNNDMTTVHLNFGLFGYQNYSILIIQKMKFLLASILKP
jgi:hypothetical protein